MLYPKHVVLIVVGFAVNVGLGGVVVAKNIRVSVRYYEQKQAIILSTHTLYFL